MPHFCPISYIKLNSQGGYSHQFSNPSIITDPFSYLYILHVHGLHQPRKPFGEIKRSCYTGAKFTEQAENTFVIIQGRHSCSAQKQHNKRYHCLCECSSVWISANWHSLCLGTPYPVSKLCNSIQQCSLSSSTKSLNILPAFLTFPLYSYLDFYEVC